MIQLHLHHDLEREAAERSSWKIKLPLGC